MDIALVGCGSIGEAIANAADNDPLLEVVALFDIDYEKATALGRKLKSSPKVFTEIRGLLQEDSVDLVVEAASQDAVKQYGVQVLESGKHLLVMSVGAFVDDRLFKEMKETAEEKDARIYIPSGAVLGIDGLKSACMAGIDAVTLTTRKNPDALGVDVDKETLLYDGPAREGVKKYPRNVNVAATVSLAGIGLNKTRLRIIADPAVDRNRHELVVAGAFGGFTVKAENLPSPGNPKTSYLAALSAIATLKKISCSVQIGT